MDYLATVTVVGTLQGQDGASMEDLKGLPLPLRVKGELDKPEIGLDPKALAEALLKNSFKKGTKDLEKKPQELHPGHQAVHHRRHAAEEARQPAQGADQKEVIENTATKRVGRTKRPTLFC